METKEQRAAQIRLEKRMARAAGAGVGVLIAGLVFGLFFSKNKFVRLISLAILIGIVIYFFGDNIKEYMGYIKEYYME